VALLHAGLLVRLVGGDAWGLALALPIGGALSAAAIVLFAATAATLAVRASSTRTEEGMHVAS
jgi:hypothetical protein